MNPELTRSTFIELIEKNQGIIHKISKLYAKSETDQEDIFQDIIVQLWESYPSFKGKSKPTTWMYRVALNTAITRFRKDKKNSNIESISDDCYEIPDVVEESDEHKVCMLNKALNILNDSEKALIMLSMEGLTYEEIAEVTGMTGSNVGVKIHRVKKKLQEILNTMGDE